jgi:hypothetical protein
VGSAVDEADPAGHSRQYRVGDLTKDLWVRKYAVAGGRVTEVDAKEYPHEGCKLELVALTMDRDAGPSAWSFGLESFGSSPRRNFDLVCAEVMEPPPPLLLDAGASHGYPDWLLSTERLKPVGQLN